MDDSKTPTIGEIRQTIIDQTLAGSEHVMLRPHSDSLDEWFLLPQELALAGLDEITANWTLVQAGMGTFSACERIVFAIFASHALMHQGKPPLPRVEEIP